MYNYDQINELFGTPLDVVQKPVTPFKVKTWHIVGGIIVLGLCSYGLHQFYKNHLSANKPRKRKFEYAFKKLEERM
jgi:hypothetical protein